MTESARFNALEGNVRAQESPHGYLAVIEG
jgi:hypothetical protein